MVLSSILTEWNFLMPSPRHQGKVPLEGASVLHFGWKMRVTLRTITGILSLGILGFTLAWAIAEGFSLVTTTEPLIPQILLGVGVFALLAIAYGILDHQPTTQEDRPSVQKSEERSPSKPSPKITRPETLPGTFEQLKTYIDLEMWELALDRAEHILRNYPETKEATAIRRNINDLRWKAEPKFVDRKQNTVSEAEERRLKEEGMSRFVQHIRTYMELEMWELAKQKASAFMKSFPESEAAKEVAKLWPQIESRGKPAMTGETKE